MPWIDIEQTELMWGLQTCPGSHQTSSWLANWLESSTGVIHQFTHVLGAA